MARSKSKQAHTAMRRHIKHGKKIKELKQKIAELKKQKGKA